MEMRLFLCFRVYLYNWNVIYYIDGPVGCFDLDSQMDQYFFTLAYSTYAFYEINIERFRESAFRIHRGFNPT